jgi:hypothetical protein
MAAAAMAASLLMIDHEMLAEARRAATMLPGTLPRVGAGLRRRFSAAAGDLKDV